MSPQLDSLRMSESYFLFFMGIFTKLSSFNTYAHTFNLFLPICLFLQTASTGRGDVSTICGWSGRIYSSEGRQGGQQTLSLSFTKLPERFQSETSIEFSVVPFHDSVERKQISFLLSGVPVPDSVEWNEDSVIEEVVRGVGVALDVDPSRIKDVALQELDWVCHYLFSSVQDKREHTAHMQGIHIPFMVPLSSILLFHL